MGMTRQGPFGKWPRRWAIGASVLLATCASTPSFPPPKSPHVLFRFAWKDGKPVTEATPH